MLVLFDTVLQKDFLQKKEFDYQMFQLPRHSFNLAIDSLSWDASKVVDITWEF